MEKRIGKDKRCLPEQVSGCCGQLFPMGPHKVLKIKSQPNSNQRKRCSVIPCSDPHAVSINGTPAQAELQDDETPYGGPLSLPPSGLRHQHSEWLCLCAMPCWLGVVAKGVSRSPEPAGLAHLISVIISCLSRSHSSNVSYGGKREKCIF